MPSFSHQRPLTCNRHHEVVIYRNTVPTWVPELLAELYGSLYGVLPAIHAIDGNTSEGIVTYLGRNKKNSTDLPDTLLMFCQNERSVRVLNEGMQLDPTSIASFCEHVFETMPQVTQIDFHAIAPPAPPPTHDTVQRARPTLRWPCTEDIVISLPQSSEAYLHQLGKATRKSIKKHLSRARKALRHFSHHVITGSAIGDELVHHIVRLNHARMIQKGRESAIDERATRELICLMRAYGETGIILNGTQLCAGTLTCRFGEDVFSLVNAHDPAFDDLGLGNVCRHLMILQAIQTRARRFHLLGGNLPAKRPTLADRQTLYHLTIYRNRRAVLADLDGIARQAAGALVFRLHCWIEDRQASSPLDLISSLRSARRRRLYAMGHRPQPRADAPVTRETR